MWVISPLVAKSTSASLAGSRLPLPETVDWITPRSTVAVRSWALEVAGEPTTSTATTIARGRQRRERQGGEGGPARHLSSRSCSRALAALRRLPVRRAPPEGHAALLQRRAQLLELRGVGAGGCAAPWPDGGWPFWPDGGWPFWPLWPPGGPPLAPRGRLGTVTPSFFRHAATFGSCRKPRRPPPGWVAPALALLVVPELELPQAARQRAMRRAPTAAQAGREVLTSRQ